MPEFSLSPFEPLADRVWRAVAEPETVTVGLVAGDEGALVVDTGSSPAQGAAIRAAAQAVAGVPIVAVVVTHGHYDHWFGLAAFDDVRSFGHASLDGDDPDEAALAALGVDRADLRTPSEPLNLVWAVDLGGRRVEIVHFGPAHTAGDVIVVVPDAKVVFTGDLVESSGPPSFEDGSDLRGWTKVLDCVVGLLPDDGLAVPGHGAPVSRRVVMETWARIASLNAGIAGVLDRGVPPEMALETGREWPFPDEVIAPVLRRAYAAAPRGPRRLPLLDR